MADTLFPDRAQRKERDLLLIDGLGGDVVPSKLSQYRAGFAAMNMTTASPHGSFATTVQGFYTMFTYFEAMPDTLLHVRKSDDIVSAYQQQKLGVIFGLQDGTCLESNLPLLTILKELGLRVLGLTYNERNALGDGCMEPNDQGLTHFGGQVVRDLHRLGIVLDLSHTSYRTSMDAMEIAEKPPIFSHSNPYALTPSSRCIKDDQIKRVAELGGTVGISVYSPMTYNEAGVRPNIGDLLDRIDYVVNLTSVDNVAIGTDIFEGKNPILWRATTKRRYPDMVGDFDYNTLNTAGFENHLEVDNLIDGLRKRGYSDADVGKIMGGNLLRVYSAWF